MNKRKIRRYRRQRGNSGVKFLGILGIMMVAVICGYLTARFVIAPLMGYDAEVLKLNFPSDFLEVFHDGAEKSENDGQPEDSRDSGQNGDFDEKSDETGGYALQFGLFSSRSRAEELQEKLEDEGIDTEIKKTEGQYKVISPLADTKDEALETLKNTESKYVDDIFITKI